MAQLVISPTCVAAQHGRDRLTRPAPAMRATGVAGCGRAVPGLRATPCPLPVFARTRPGTQAKGPLVHGRDQGPVPHRRKLREDELPRRGSYRVWPNSRRHASAGRPQESPKSPQVSPRDRAVRTLLFAQDRGAGLAGDVTGRPGESRSGAFESPFAGSSDSRNERPDRDVSLNPSYSSLSTEELRRDESSCTVE